MGYDGVFLARYSVPRLTTVCQDADLMARRGVELLLAQIREEGEPVHETAPFRLLEGASVARPREENKGV